MTIVSSGQLPLTNLNDSKALQLFLSNSQPNTQVYNQTTGGYTPDWTSTNPVLTPELYVPGTATNIIAQAKSISWFDGGTPISSGTNYTLGTGNKTLTINNNRVIAVDDALSFDGSTTAVSVGTIFASAPTALTVHAKFRMTANPATYTTIADFGSADATNGKAIYMEGVTGTAKVLFGAAVTSGGNAWSGASSELQATVGLNQFYTATMVLTATTMTVYINGVQQGTVSGTFDLTRASANAFGIGGVRSKFNGDIAYVGIFNTAVQPEFVAQYATNGLKGTEPGLVNYYNLVTASGTTVTDSVGGKNGTISGTFTLPSAATIHKKNIMCQVVYTDPAVNTDLTVSATLEINRAYAGATGNQGSAVTMAVLSNDNSVVTTANDGTGGTYGAPNTQSILTIYQGGTDVTSLYTISQTRNNVTVTEATTSTTATVTAMSADTGSVVFTATRTGFPTITKTFNLLKSKTGVTASNPTDYWLNSSVSNITAADDGSYNPTTITFSAESQTGTNAVAAYSGRFIIAESTDGTNFTTKYTSAADESSKVYTPSSGLAAIKVSLYQAGGTSIKLDDQTIPVINNGKNSVMVSAWTPGGNVIRNAGNTVTAEADLLNGGLPATGTNYRWVKQNGAKTSVIAGAGYEDLDLPKRNFVRNGDFAIGTVPNSTTAPTDWTFFGPATDVTKVYTSQGTGNYTKPGTLYIGHSDQGDSGIKQTIVLHTNMTYTASFALGKENVNSVYAQINYYDVSNNLLSSSVFNYDMNNQDKIQSFTFTTPATFDHCAFVHGGIAAVYNNGFLTRLAYVKVEPGTGATAFSYAYEDSTIASTDNTLYGRNLLLDSGLNNGTTNWGFGANWVTDGTQYISGYNVKTCDRTALAVSQSSYSDMTQTMALPSNYQLNTPYTVSFWVKCTAGSGSTLPFRWYFTNITGISADNAWTPFTTTTGWTKVYKTITFTTKQNGLTPVMYFRCFDGNAVSITQPKWEQTPYMTDYSPAPEDNVSVYPNSAAGANKWIFRFYTDGNNATDKIYGYSDLASLTPTYQTLLADQVNVQQNLAEYYVGYYKTAVYVSTAKTVNFTTNVDDTLNVLVNGLQQFSQLGTGGGTTKTIPLSLQAGWNSVELITQEITGADGVWNTNPLSSLVDEMNCNYALDYGSLKGNYGLIGYNSSSMIVNTNAVTDTDMFMCLVTYRGSVYKDTVTIDDITDPVTIIVNGSRIFKNGQGTITYTATLWQNGAQIDINGTQYTYTWYVYNSDGSLDTSFGGTGSKTGQTITVASSDINVRGRIQCVVSQ